jgi:trk system potassium uptake protein TrkH
LIHPRAVVRIKVGQKPLPPDYVMNVVALSGLFLGLTGFGFVALAFMGVDLTTALSASIACLFNIGPGMGQVGPTADYAGLPEGGKWIMVLWMLMGRLEIFGILLLFLPMTWRK